MTPEVAARLRKRIVSLLRRRDQMTGAEIQAAMLGCSEPMVEIAIGQLCAFRHVECVGGYARSTPAASKIWRAKLRIVADSTKTATSD
jgi:hypothetical protein